MKKLCFDWALSKQVNSMEEITEEEINIQKSKLDNMLSELKCKLNDLSGVSIYSYEHKDCNGRYGKLSDPFHSYNVNNRMGIIIEKVGRKTTWDDVYKTINTVKAACYKFI